MAVTTIQPNGTAGLDTFIDASQADVNYGTETALRIGTTAPSTGRALIKFAALSDGTIPGSVNVVRAVLSIFFRDSNSTERVVRVFRVKRAWVEAQATWNVYSTGNGWQTAGCSGANDVEATDIGSATVPATPSAGQEIQFSLTPSAVEAMIRGSWANNGFLLKADTEDNDIHQYYSSDEVTETARRPKIVVTWSNGFISFF